MNHLKCSKDCSEDTDHGPLLACTGLCSNFIHEKCYETKEQAGLCPDCCNAEKKAPTSKHIFVRVLQLTNLVIGLTAKIESQEIEIKNLRETLTARNSTHLPSKKDVKNGKNDKAASSSDQTAAVAASRNGAAAPAPVTQLSTSASGSRDHQHRARSRSRGKQTIVPERAPNPEVKNVAARKEPRPIARKTTRGVKEGPSGLGVARRPVHRKLYVSNALMSVTKEQMCDYVKAMDVTVLTVYKLRTASQRTTSWCLLIQEESFARALDPTNWGSDLCFREFKGNLHKEQILDSLEIQQ